MLTVSALVAGGMLLFGASKLVPPTDDAEESERTAAPGVKQDLKDFGTKLRDRTKDALGKGQALLAEQTSWLRQDARQAHAATLRDDRTDSDEPALVEKSEAELEVDHHLKVSGIGSAVALAGLVTHTPLVLLSIPFTVYSCIPLLKVVHKGIVEDKKLRGPVVDLVALSASMAAHYYTLTAISCTLMCVAEKLVFMAQDRSRRDMASIFKKQNPHVWMVVGDEEREVALTDVQIGDVIVVVAGGIIPVDGVIASGEACIDQHMLTGESKPVEKVVGDAVFASTVVLVGHIRIRVETTGDATITAQIGAVMDEISDYQERQELRCDETADKLVWPTLAAGAVMLGLRGIASAATMVGCNFTETLRIAYPLGALSYLNLAAKEGILVKDGRALETLRNVDTLLFDKTGTLTLARPHVAVLHPVEGMDEATLLGYAAAAEFHQTHPIAQAIQAAATERKCPPLSVHDVAYDIGYGIRVTVSMPPANEQDRLYNASTEPERAIRVGSARYMAREGITVPEYFQTLEERCHVNGDSLVYVAVDHDLAGAIELHPTLRPEVRVLMTNLKQRGLKLYLVSGDHSTPTKHLAEMLEFDGFRAEVLPIDKARFVEQLQNEGRKVCFIGDGINDAIALKQADVSISLRGATTVATDVAGVILMDQDLTRIEQLLDFAAGLDANANRSLAAMLIPSMANVVGVLFFHLGIRSSLLLFNASLLAGVCNGIAPSVMSRSDKPNAAARMPIPT